MQQLGEPIMIPKATIDILKDQVFGFDTFFITRQEPYEVSVIFFLPSFTLLKQFCQGTNV